MKFKEFLLPDELLYNTDSSWIKIDGDVAIIGLIEPIAKTLSEFLFVKLPEKKLIKKGEIYVSLETLKWSGHLTSPLSGEIIEVNESLFDEPNKLNNNPYKEWIMKIKIVNKNEAKELFKSNQIIDWLNETVK